MRLDWISQRLDNPRKAGDSVDMTVGQQTAKYPAELLVGKEVVLKAAKLFAETGKLLFDRDQYR